MAWYSYFLLSVPEIFAMTLLTFTILGISINKKQQSIILFAFIDGAITFSASIFLTNSLKPLITFIAYSLLVALIFKLKMINGFIIGLISFVCLMLFELTLSLMYIHIFSFDYEAILINPWQRILVSAITTTMPMLTLAFIFQKAKVTIKMPLLFK